MYRFALLVYNLVFPLLFTVYLPFYLLRLRKRGEFRTGFGERFGLYDAAKRARLAALHRPVWVHAVSVGETVAALGFIRLWHDREPERGFILSTTTNTAQALARQKAPDYVVPVYFPLDFGPVVGRALNVLRPTLLVIFEVEVWPMLLHAAQASRIPTALVNARMSPRSAAGFARHGWFFRQVFRRFWLVAAQTAGDAASIRQVAGEELRLETCGTMKFDQVPDRRPSDVQQLLAQAFGPEAGLLFCAASTHPGEEEIMLRAWRALAPEPRVRLVIVPRHVERLPDVVALCDHEQQPYVTLTALRAGQPQSGPKRNPVLIVNTTGELMDFLGAADIVYVGKSLGGNSGGHNIIEPAIFGKPIVFGEHMENFRDVARIFKEAHAAVEVRDEIEFATALARLVASPEERQRLGQLSRQTVERNRGAMTRTLDLLATLEKR